MLNPNPCGAPDSSETESCKIKRGAVRRTRSPTSFWCWPTNNEHVHIRIYLSILMLSAILQCMHSASFKHNLHQCRSLIIHIHPRRGKLANMQRTCILYPPKERKPILLYLVCIYVCTPEYVFLVKNYRKEISHHALPTSNFNVFNFMR